MMNSNLWDIGVELDDIHTYLEQIINMLFVYGESMEREFDAIKDSALGEHFNARYDTIKSVLDVAIIRLCETLDNMRVQIDAVYEAGRTQITE